ncbi:MAG: cache domain-containing protein [Helicobacteraceae bacterium]|jgi:hypothetical protein|nr:cache domain-containing protein [Helicobacteraceae bacterium]
MIETPETQDNAPRNVAPSGDWSDQFRSPPAPKLLFVTAFLRRNYNYIAAFLLAILAITAANCVGDYLVKREKETTLASVKVFANDLQNWIDQHVYFTRVMASLPTFRNGSRADISLLLRKINAGQSLPDEISRMAFVGLDGRSFHGADDTLDMSTRQVYLQIVRDKSREFIISNIYLDRVRDEQVFSVGVAVKDQNDNVKGALFVLIKTKVFTARALKATLNRNARPLMIDENGVIFAYDYIDNTQDKITLKNARQFGLKGLAAHSDEILESKTGGYFDYNGVDNVDRVLFYAPMLKTQGFIFGAGVDSSKIYAKKYISFAFAFGFIALSFVAAYILSRNTALPPIANGKNSQIST